LPATFAEKGLGRVFELHREILKNAAFLAQRGETLPEHSRD
jgi:hypothetical protein